MTQTESAGVVDTHETIGQVGIVLGTDDWGETELRVYSTGGSSLQYVCAVTIPTRKQQYPYGGRCGGETPRAVSGPILLTEPPYVVYIISHSLRLYTISSQEQTITTFGSEKLHT